VTTSSLSTSQAARILGLSAERVRQLADSHALACTRTELGRLFDPDEVDRYARARTIADTPETEGPR